MRILRSVFAGQIGGGRHDLRPPVLLADLERHEDLDGLVDICHSAATFFRGAIMSRMKAMDSALVDARAERR
jgi:hypothetical protein